MAKTKALGLFFALALLTAAASYAEPLKIAYSDWPGWVAWDIGVKKGFFKAAGVDVQFVWFEYGPSMEAFSAGSVDAVAVTNGDALVTGSTGAKAVMILVNDYSNGNDMIVAKPGVKSVKELKGKKVGVEIGFVDHLLLLNALKANGMKESDVTLVPIQTNQAAQVLASGGVDAICAWQPHSGQALLAMPGAKAIYSSADAPGLIYDTLAVKPESLAKNKAAWTKVVKVWYQIVDYLKDEKNKKEILEIMSARVNLSPQAYAEFMQGTRFLSLTEAKKVFVPSESLTSLYGSSLIVDAFNVSNKVYPDAQKVDSYIDPSLILSLK